MTRALSANNQLITDHRCVTAKEDRLKIKTALDLRESVVKIAERVRYSKQQIYYIRNLGLEPLEKRCGVNIAVSED